MPVACSLAGSDGLRRVGKSHRGDRNRSPCLYRARTGRAREERNFLVPHGLAEVCFDHRVGRAPNRVQVNKYARLQPTGTVARLDQATLHLHDSDFTLGSRAGARVIWFVRLGDFSARQIHPSFHIPFTGAVIKGTAVAAADPIIRVLGKGATDGSGGGGRFSGPSSSMFCSTILSTSLLALLPHPEKSAYMNSSPIQFCV